MEIKKSTNIGRQGQKLVVHERDHNASSRNEGPEHGKSPEGKSMENLPIITTEQRKTGRVG